MTGLCGRQIMRQGRAHASSSARNIYTILWAHLGEALSFVVCATEEPGQPPSHCFGDAFSLLCTPGGKRLPLPCHVLREQHSEPPRGSACSGLGMSPATPDSWLARAKCDRSEWPEGELVPMDSELGLFPRNPQGRLWSRHSGGGSHTPWTMLTCPVSALGNRATGLIVLCLPNGDSELSQLLRSRKTLWKCEKGKLMNIISSSSEPKLR